MYAFVQHMCTLRPQVGKPPSTHTYARDTFTERNMGKRKNMLNVTSASAGRLYATKAYKPGQLVCKMDKPKVIPVYTRDLSQYGPHVDSWESLRQRDKLPHSWVVFDKRKECNGSNSIKRVWYDLSLSDYQEHDLFPMWVGIANGARAKANVEMAAHGKLAGYYFFGIKNSS